MSNFENSPAVLASFLDSSARLNFQLKFESGNTPRNLTYDSCLNLFITNF